MTTTIIGISFGVLATGFACWAWARAARERREGNEAKADLRNAQTYIEELEETVENLLRPVPTSGELASRARRMLDARKDGNAA